MIAVVKAIDRIVSPIDRGLEHSNSDRNIIRARLDINHRLML